jgi:hypothetical protein
MRKHLTLLLAIAIGSLAVAATAWAGFPHILRYKDPVLVDGSSTSGATSLAAAKASTTSVVSDPRVFVEEIVVTGVKEGVTTRLTAPFEAVYVCVNGGGSVPSAANKTTFVGSLEASALFPAAKNGKATGSLLTGPLPSSADAAAATGFHLARRGSRSSSTGSSSPTWCSRWTAARPFSWPRSSCPNRCTA